MAYAVRAKGTDRYLQTPHRFGDGDEFWMWTPKQDDAHHFPTRGEAKATLRRINPDFQVKNFTFHVVGKD